MKIYRGIRYDGHNGWRRKVFVDEKPLAMRTDLLELSNAFEWGYGGSGPSQLAFAILADHFQNQPDGDERAIALHYKFEREVIKKLPRSEWTRLGRLLAKTDNWQENKGGGIEEVK